MQLSEEEKTKFETFHHGFDQNTISTRYDTLSEDYENLLNTVGWPDPDETARQVIEYGFTADSEVLDMGCGTGMVADYLKKHTEVDQLKIIGIDASEGMILKATAKGIYAELRKTMLCDPESFKLNQEDLLERFDFVTASGLLAAGHATAAVFDEMILALKKGGYAVFTSRNEYLEPLGYQKGIDEQLESGKWELVTKKAYEKYSNAKDQDLGGFKPTISEVFVFRKL